MEYLALPLVLRDGYFDRADLGESITYSVGLLLSTRQGMMKFNPGFGCNIWEKEYSDVYAANKAEIRSSLRDAIDKYERRLKNVSVSLQGVDGSSGMLGAVVKVSAYYEDDGQEKRFEASYVLG